MPALPPLSGVYKILLRYALPAVPTVLNQIFAKFGGSSTSSQLNTWATNIAGAWSTSMAPHTIPACSLTSVQVIDLTSATSPNITVASAIPGSITGSVAGTADDALVISNIMAKRQRGGHSRIYLPGPDMRWLATGGGGQWGASSVSPVLTAWNNFLTAIFTTNPPVGSTGLKQVVAHYYKGFTVITDPVTGRARNKPKLDPDGPSAIDVTATTYNPVVGSQRRRNTEG